MAAAAHGLYDSELDLPYSDASVLNTVDVYLPREASWRDTSQRFWIVFIHGGGWRDPRESSKAIVPALQFLSPVEYPIAGIASINYRLSEHDQFPAEPGTPDHKARSVTHPTHIEDVLAATAWLQDHHRFGSKYLLAGHSAGGTMAFQSVMGTWTPSGRGVRGFDLPSAVVGVCGIYDVPLLLKNHPDVPIYRKLIEAAFGTAQSDWETVSPVNGRFHDTWPNGIAAVIAPSKDDDMIEFAQAEVMSDHLWREKRQHRRDVVISLSGKHEQVWKEGVELARALKKGLEMLS